MSYLQEFLIGKNINKIVKKAKTLLKDWEFTHIAVRGNSGLLIGAPLAMRMKKELIIVRKNGIISHGNRVEGAGTGQKILIVDDFISTGKTIKEIKKNIIDTCAEFTFVGIFCYNSPREDGKYRGLPILNIPENFV